jgi:hypothetical protein
MRADGESSATSAGIFTRRRTRWNVALAGEPAVTLTVMGDEQNRLAEVLMICAMSLWFLYF